LVNQQNTYRLLNIFNEPEIKIRALFLACNRKELNLFIFYKDSNCTNIIHEKVSKQPVMLLATKVFIYIVS